MPSAPRWSALALVGCALLSAREARASVPDVFGLGSEESAVAGASVARVHDFSSVHYNPAGLTLARRPEVSLGLGGFISFLHIDGSTRRTQPLTDPLLVSIGAATPVPFGGVLADRIYIGIALGLVPGTLVRVISHTPEQPFYPYYDNRTQRLLVEPGLALRLPAGVSVGVAFNYLAGLGGRVAAAEGATRTLEARVDEQIYSHLAVNAGVRWQATRALAVGVTYRQAFSVPFRTLSRNQVAGEPIDLDVDADGLYTPHELVAGAAYKLPFRVTASLDVQWSKWSDYRGPFVTVSSALPLVGAIDARPPQVAYHDTVGVRGGLEWTAVEKRFSALILRGGYAFESQAVTADQPGVTNLLDGNKHRLALGGGLRFDLLGATVRADIHGQLDIVQPETLTKKVAQPGDKPDPSKALADEVPDDPQKPSTLGTQISNPGWPSISGSGVIWALGFTLTVGLK